MTDLPEKHMTLADLLEAVFSLNEDAPMAQVVATMDKLKAFQQTLNEYKRLMEDGVIDWIKKNGEIEVGDLRLYVGEERKIKCRDFKGTLEAILSASGGDMEALVSCLSSNAFKPGACRETLPPSKYRDLFVTTVEPDLKKGIAKKQKLLSVNKNFLTNKHEPEKEES